MKIRTFFLALLVGVFSSSLVGQTAAQLETQIKAEPAKLSELVAAAVKANPAQAGALVEAALRAAPNSVVAIVSAAVNAVQSTAVPVTQAAVNAQPQNAKAIVNAAARAAVSQFAAIQAAALAVLQAKGPSFSSVTREVSSMVVSAVVATLPAVLSIQPDGNTSPIR